MATDNGGQGKHEWAFRCMGSATNEKGKKVWLFTEANRFDIWQVEAETKAEAFQIIIDGFRKLDPAVAIEKR
jgi:hypothetical protein